MPKQSLLPLEKLKPLPRLSFYSSSAKRLQPVTQRRPVTLLLQLSLSFWTCVLLVTQLLPAIQPVRRFARRPLSCANDVWRAMPKLPAIHLLPARGQPPCKWRQD